MRIGVVSDTHNHLGNVARMVRLLNEARVDRVVHTVAHDPRELAELDLGEVGVALYGHDRRGPRGYGLRP